MLKTRVMPCLLLKGPGLIKTVKFDKSKYVGDPINAVKIFNEKEVDELVFVDISATPGEKEPQYDLLQRIASECFMPFAYGGGINSIEQIQRLFKIGVEKVAINSAVFSNPELITKASEHFGAQSIVGAIDVKKSLFGKYEVVSHSGKKKQKVDPVTHAQNLEKLGVGEIFLNSVDQDGSLAGFDLKLIQTVSDAVNVPVIACGGCNSVKNIGEAAGHGASGVAAGSFFVFHGPHRAVLINFPSQAELKGVLN